MLIIANIIGNLRLSFFANISAETIIPAAKTISESGSTPFSQKFPAADLV